MTTNDPLISIDEPDEAVGFGSSLEHFETSSVRLVLLLKRYVLRFWRRMTDKAGQLNDTFVSLHEALSSLGAVDPDAGSPVEPPPNVEAQLATIERRLHEASVTMQRRLAVSVGGPALPIEDVRALFGLDDIGLDIVLLLVRIQTDQDFARLCTFAWADFTRKQPTVAFLVDLLGTTPAERSAVAEALKPHAPLVEHGLVTLVDPGDWRPVAPALHHLISVSDRVCDYIRLGRQGWSSPPAGAHEIQMESGLEDLFIAPKVLDEAREAWLAVTRSKGCLAFLNLWGPHGVGKTGITAFLAQRDHRALLALDLQRALASKLGFWDAVSAFFRDARLLDAHVMVQWDEAAASMMSAHDPQWQSRLGDICQSWRGPLVVLSTYPQGWLGDVAHSWEVQVPFTSPQHQREAWTAALKALELRGAQLTAEYFANRFNMGAETIKQVVSGAATLARARGGRRAGRIELGESDIVMAARNHSNHRLGDLATLAYTTMGMDDLVLNDETRVELASVERMMRHRAQVYDTWGFRKVLGGRQGMRVMFCGPPGTGKTLAATILGGRLGRDVYRIDLSQMVDKYIGETEKNLARLFDESEHANVVLLFDEADSLFGSRTSVNTSHDRHANLQVNYLLQRIEEFEGVCILTTNYEENIDAAFKRRLQSIVRFPAPDEDSRAALWKGLLPSTAAVSPDVDFARLARQYQLAGGHIRNAVVRAAFAAADTGGVITERHLDAAAFAVARQLGHAVREVP